MRNPHHPDPHPSNPAGTPPARRTDPHIGRRAISLLGCVLLTACATPEPPPPLPVLQLDADRISVSGLSAGAYMAHQAHLAFGNVKAAGLIAGGPYHCAEGRLDVALQRCMNPSAEGVPSLDVLQAQVERRAAAGELAPLDALAGDRVYLLHGRQDAVVGEQLAVATSALYRRLAPDVAVHEDFARDFAHLLPTAAEGDDCSRSETPYIGRCGFDAVGEMFRVLHGTDPAAPGAGDGELLEFDQRPHVAEGTTPQLADRGFLYVPSACARGASCGLHIVFHGCEQGAEKIGDRFVRESGHARWADAAGLVVLYPQVRASMAPLNPKGCWDWWGYSGPGYDTRSGAQLSWLKRAVASLGVELH